jgi:DNA-directed RNA polymerase specialized sigma subunit
MNNVVVFSPVALTMVLGVSPSDPEVFRRESLRVRRYVNELPKIERRVIVWLFGLFEPEMTAREIAERMRLTPEAILAIEESALGRLREMYGAPSLLERAA